MISDVLKRQSKIDKTNETIEKVKLAIISSKKSLGYRLIAY